MRDSHSRLLLHTTTGPLHSLPQNKTHSPAPISTTTAQRFKCQKRKSTGPSAHFGDTECKQPQPQEPRFWSILETLLYSLSNYATTPIPAVAKGLGLRPLACWGLRVRIPPEHWYLSLVSAVCCQVQVSASGSSLVQRSPTECGMWALPH